MDIAKLKIGDKVHYTPREGVYENGMVKEIPDHTNTQVRVVYNCGSDWDNFMDYTSALTPISKLCMGWKH